NQLLLAGIRIDVPDREYARDVGLEFLRVDVDRALVDPQTPVRDRPELRVQAEEHQRLVRVNLMELTVETLQAHSAERLALRQQRMRDGFDVTHAAVSHEVTHLGD